MKKYWKPFKWPGLRNVPKLQLLFLSLLFFSFSPAKAQDLTYRIRPHFEDIPIIISKGFMWLYVTDLPLCQDLTYSTVKSLLSTPQSTLLTQTAHLTDAHNLVVLVFLRELLSRDVSNARTTFLTGLSCQNPHFIALAYLALRHGLWGAKSNLRCCNQLLRYGNTRADERILNHYASRARIEEIWPPIFVSPVFTLKRKNKAGTSRTSKRRCQLSSKKLNASK